MEIRGMQGEIARFECDAVVVNLFEGVTEPGGATGAVDAALDGRIRAAIASGDLGGKLGDTRLLYTDGRTSAPRVLVVGLGPAGSFGLEEARRASAAAASAAGKLGVRHLATITHGAGIGGLDPAAAAQATAEGAALGLYDFRAYKRAEGPDAEGGSLEWVTLVERDPATLPSVRAGAAVGASVAAGVRLARDLANHPANVATPTYLAERAGEIAERFGMALEVWDRERIEGEGMGAFASVARGSAEEPRFIVLSHQPVTGPDVSPTVIVGKGLTFDSGGLSLKPGKGMGAMKYDMAGAAAVLGAMDVVGRLGLPIPVTGLVAATENMPGGRASRPGDIVRALNGTTIEILNTDAEGRLVLADGLAWAVKYREPQEIVDLATLTGSQMVATGKNHGALVSNDEAFEAEVLAAGRSSGDVLHPLPFAPELFRSELSSHVADMRNAAKDRSHAGSSVAAQFLANQLEGWNGRWAHVDMVGLATTNGRGTGYGVPLLLTLAGCVG